jgi:hypothetical protein
MTILLLGVASGVFLMVVVSRSQMLGEDTYGLDARGVEANRATEAVRVSQATPVEGWSELVVALPEFILTDACIDADGEPSPASSCP